jgi:hypothetical protein
MGITLRAVQRDCHIGVAEATQQLLTLDSTGQVRPGSYLAGS